MRWLAVVLSASVVALAGFIGWAAGDDARVTAAQPSEKATSSVTTARLRDFAYRQMEKQSEKTCRIMPRKALARAFGEASGDPVHVQEPASASDNYVALWYAEDVRIRPVRLQQAAYDGCLAGLAARR